MSEPTKLDRPLLFAGEAENEDRLFNKNPLLIISKYLDCFDSSGRQVLEVPTHVQQALASRLLRFWSGPKTSIDAAFGGKVAQRRNGIRTVDREERVLLAMEIFIARLRKRIANARRPCGLTEANINFAAARYAARSEKLTVDNVLRIRTKYSTSALKKANSEKRSADNNTNKSKS